MLYKRIKTVIKVNVDFNARLIEVSASRLLFVQSFSFVLLLFMVGNSFIRTKNPLKDLVKKYMIKINRSVLYWHHCHEHSSSYKENVYELIL